MGGPHFTDGANSDDFENNFTVFCTCDDKSPGSAGGWWTGVGEACRIEGMWSEWQGLESSQRG